MNAIPLINNIPKTNINNEKQLRQEINTSLVALKKEAGTLEGLINEAAQMLVTINNRIATLENDTVKKSDIVDVVQSGNLQPVTSNAVYDNSFKMLLSENNDPDNYPTDAVRIYKVRNYSVLSWLGDNGFIITIPWSNNYIFQIAVDDQSNFCAVRSKSTTWNSWQKIIKSSDVINAITSGSLDPVSSGAVASELVDGSSWISFAGEQLTGQLWYKKVGKTVFLKISSTDIKFTGSGATMAYATSGNTVYLPSAIRPSYQTNFFLNDNVKDSAIHARILPDGTIKAWSNPNVDISTITSWQVDFCYRID